MRIYYAAAASPNYWGLPDSKLWDVNLYQPLLDLGHDVVRFRYDFGPHNNHLDPLDPGQKQFIDANRPRLGEELLRQVRAAHRRAPLDLFFSYFYSAYVHPDVIPEISKMGIPTVNWYCNGSYQFDLVKEIAPAYDFCLVPEKFRMEDYRRAGANPIYCQEAANPNVYKPYEDLEPQYDVTFVGQRYGNRPDYVKRLIKAGVDVRVWGPRWNQPPKKVDADPGLDAELSMRVGPPLSDEELVRMYSRSRISLGFSAVAKVPGDGSPPIKQVRLRDFEAPMSGAFYMTEYFEELAEFFKPDEEVVFFNDADELADKAKFYLANPIERERIRIKGMIRARLRHTWHARFEQVFAKMGLPGRVANRKIA